MKSKADPKVEEETNETDIDKIEKYSKSSKSGKAKKSDEDTEGDFLTMVIAFLEKRESGFWFSISNIFNK